MNTEISKKWERTETTRSCIVRILRATPFAQLWADTRWPAVAKGIVLCPFPALTKVRNNPARAKPRRGFAYLVRERAVSVRFTTNYRTVENAEG